MDQQPTSPMNVDSSLSTSSDVGMPAKFIDSAISEILTECAIGDEPSFVDEVYHEILLRIIRGDLPEGAVLTSTRLADELKVSRTPVVAAIDRLTTDGILRKEKNKRAVIRDSAGRWLHQVHGLREIVEPPAARMAAKIMPEEVLDHLERLGEAAAPSPKQDWMAAAREFDYALHLSIANHCNNLVLRKTIYKCWSYKRLTYEATHSIPENVELGYREHLAILQALLRRDAESAYAAMLFHLRSAGLLKVKLNSPSLT